MSVITTADSDHRRSALLRSLCGRLESANLDELRALDYVYLRLEVGRERYGALDLARDSRDWTVEMAEERADFLLYQAFRELAEQAARVDTINGVTGPEIELRDE